MRNLPPELTSLPALERLLALWLLELLRRLILALLPPSPLPADAAKPADSCGEEGAEAPPPPAPFHRPPGDRSGSARTIANVVPVLRLLSVLLVLAALERKSSLAHGAPSLGEGVSEATTCSLALLSRRRGNEPWSSRSAGSASSGPDVLDDARRERLPPGLLLTLPLPSAPRPRCSARGEGRSSCSISILFSTLDGDLGDRGG